ncbi:hypothetical protein OHB12_20795 [Nocardia sp. NBC_01730]|uniref:hypothetical protein n=1 Tax=Nocardia sp. NBC_01730 TaxID=2975998 RepID=UPI002E15D1B2|nr:hypothetical protein OHB12_20795 [Nocardia sp. NBC_01730]
MLFEEVREPYRGLIEDFLNDWKHPDARLSNAEVGARFVSGLYDFVLANRDLLFALAAANRFGIRRSARRAY